MWFLEMECPGHAHVKRIEVMAKKPAASGRVRALVMSA
jgi:hypothetical protein